MFGTPRRAVRSNEAPYVFPSTSHSDPATIPLPVTSDIDLHHGLSIAAAVGYKSAPKVAGARRSKPNFSGPGEPSTKAKGKRKCVDISSASGSDSDDTSNAPVTTKKASHGGRRPGAGNYGNAEIKQLLRLTEKELPVGQNRWKRIHAKYEAWAAKHGQSCRDAKSLETKFKMVSH